jgi:hypothetical protein
MNNSSVVYPNKLRLFKLSRVPMVVSIFKSEGRHHTRAVREKVTTLLLLFNRK